MNNNEQNISEQMVKAIVDEKNTVALKKLEKLLQHKCANKINDVLNNQ